MLHPATTGLTLANSASTEDLHAVPAKTCILFDERSTDRKDVSDVARALSPHDKPCLRIHVGGAGRSSSIGRLDLAFCASASAGSLREALERIGAGGSCSSILFVGEFRGGHAGESELASALRTRDGTAFGKAAVMCRLQCRTGIHAAFSMHLERCASLLPSPHPPPPPSPTASRRVLRVVAVDCRLPVHYPTLVALIGSHKLVSHLSEEYSVDGPVMITSYPAEYAEAAREIDPSIECAFVPFAAGRITASNFSIPLYSRTLKSPEFWGDLQERFGDFSALMVQDDGALAFPCDLSEFVEYDFVGAPWVGAEEEMRRAYGLEGNLVGNGGVSIRRVSKMRELASEHGGGNEDEEDHVPEDVFFAKLHGHMKVPAADVARRFSSEFALDPSDPSPAFHKVWAYHDHDSVVRYLDQCKKRTRFPLGLRNSG